MKDISYIKICLKVPSILFRYSWLSALVHPKKKKKKKKKKNRDYSQQCKNGLLKLSHS